MVYSETMTDSGFPHKNNGGCDEEQRALGPRTVHIAIIGNIASDSGLQHSLHCSSWIFGYHGVTQIHWYKRWVDVVSDSIRSLPLNRLPLPLLSSPSVLV